MEENKKYELEEDVPSYEEDYTEEDFIAEALTEEAPSYVEDYTEEDFLAECFIKEGEEAVEELTEDLDTSYPVKPMSEAEIRSAAKKVVKGAKVRFGYVSEVKLDSKYAQGKFVKTQGIQYPVVKAIKVTETRACTGVRYNNTELARSLHATQQYQDKLAARQAAGLGGFGTNVHDTEKGLENILVTTSNGLKCVLAYPMSNVRPRNTYYISIDGQDWRSCTKEEIAKYMSPAAADKFLNPAAVKTDYQAGIRNNLGQNVVADDFVVRDVQTGEKVKLMPNVLNITYFDPTSRFKCIYAFDKESAVIPVVETPPVEENPLNQEFPEVE